MKFLNSLSKCKNNWLLMSVLTLSFSAVKVNAGDNYLDASLKACEHLRDCARENMGEVPEQYRAMIEQSLGSICQSLPSAESIPGFNSSHELYGPALSCMESISRLSCKQIDESGASTAECDKLNDM